MRFCLHNELCLENDLCIYSQFLSGVLKTGLEALSSRQVVDLIKTGKKMSSYPLFFQAVCITLGCLDHQDNLRDFSPFLASFSSLPLRWLEALSSRHLIRTQKLPVLKPVLILLHTCRQLDIKTPDRN